MRVWACDCCGCFMKDAECFVTLTFDSVGKSVQYEICQNCAAKIGKARLKLEEGA